MPVRCDVFCDGAAVGFREGLYFCVIALESGVSVHSASQQLLGASSTNWEQIEIRQSRNSRNGV